jgi:hypothetical protein
MATQDPYPVGHPSRKAAKTVKRTCTFAGHEGANPLPANAEHFPVRKSGAKEGAFIGWCHACQKLQAKRYKAEPERQGTRPRVKVEELSFSEQIERANIAIGLKVAA